MRTLLDAKWFDLFSRLACEPCPAAVEGHWTCAASGQAPSSEFKLQLGLKEDNQTAELRTKHTTECNSSQSLFATPDLSPGLFG